MRVIYGVAASHVLRLAAGEQTLVREVANRLERPEARPLVLPVRRRLCLQQTLFHQARQPRERTRVRGRLRGSADRIDGLRREAAGKDRQPPEELLLVRRQELLAPGDGLAQGALMRRRVTPAPG